MYCGFFSVFFKHQHCLIACMCLLNAVQLYVIRLTLGGKINKEINTKSVNKNYCKLLIIVVLLLYKSYFQICHNKNNFSKGPTVYVL